MYRLDSLADKEREKEIAFLSMIVSSPIFRKNFGHRVKELEDKLLHAIKTEKSDLGSLFTLINVAEQEINNIIDRKEWDNYRGRSIATRITDIVIEKISEIVDKKLKRIKPSRYIFSRGRSQWSRLGYESDIRRSSVARCRKRKKCCF